MGEMETRDLIERYFKAMEAGDTETLRDCYAEDAVTEWPQSGERLRGRDNIMAMFENYPGAPQIDGTPDMRVLGDTLLTQMELDYGEGGKYRQVGIVDVEDGRIKKTTEYFAAPFDAPEWRSQWVEKM